MSGLNQLLIHESFIDLNALLKNQNIFNMLNVGGRETIHSRFLGYLLDPNQTHGLGTGFLESFLLCLDDYIEPSPQSAGNVNIQPSVNIAKLDLDMSIVKCEWPGKQQRRIDVVTVIPYKESTEGRLVLAIECKVNALQGDSQLKNYNADLKDAFQEEKGSTTILHIFLTRYEESPADGCENWHNVLWQDLVNNALRVTKQKNPLALSQKLNFLISDYMNVILSWSEESGEMGAEEHCRKLKDGFSRFFNKAGVGSFTGAELSYLKAKHGEAYVCLNEYFNTDPRKKHLETFKSVLGAKNWYESDSSNKHFRFWPDVEKSYPLRPDLAPFPRVWTQDGFALLFEIEINKSDDEKLRSKLFLQLGPMNAQLSEVREVFGSELRAACKKTGWVMRGKKEIGRSWARIADLKDGFEEINEDNAVLLFEKYICAASELMPTVRDVIKKYPELVVDAIQQNP